MEIGTARPLPETEDTKKARTRLTGSAGTRGGGGGGRGPGGDGGDFPEHPVDAEFESDTADKSKYIAWFLLMAVGMTFAGLLGAYMVLATNRAAEWRPFDLPFQVWISTAIILASSIAYSFAKREVDRDRHHGARNWFLVTTVMGGLFVASQLVLWLELVNRGLYLRGNPYAGFFYILTAAHLVHVAGGIAALGSILLGSWYPARNATDVLRRRRLARSVGWYWHFMGFLWVILFLVLGFWK